MLALITGYFLQSIHVTLFLGLGGTLFSFIIAVPPWPIFNEDPERWLDPVTKGAPVTVGGKKVN
jgi:signal peptidase complex subunit 1